MHGKLKQFKEKFSKLLSSLGKVVSMPELTGITLENCSVKDHLVDDRWIVVASLACSFKE